MKRVIPTSIIYYNCTIIILSLLLLPRSTRAFTRVSLRAFHITGTATMPRGVKKEHLPSKMCVICNRPFTWRKKWERCWDEVTTCSKSCNRQRRSSKKEPTILQATTTTPTAYRTESGDDDDLEMNQKESREEELLQSRLNENSLETIHDGNDLTISLEPLNLSSFQESSSASTSLHNNDDDDSDNTSSNSKILENDDDDPVARRKAERKAAKKAKKAARRAQREGRGDPSAGQKQCDMCSKSVDLLIRCTYDESLQWKMVCGKCWNEASGGVIDGDSKTHPYYRYGGLWKNRRRR